MTFDSESLPLELVARRLKALADASRLAVLGRLCDGEKCVTELVEETGLGQANVSKHLHILLGEGFVLARRYRRNVFYRLPNGMSEEICAIICRSIREKAADEKRALARYLKRTPARKAG
ncbi:MAG: metalloregulator ArsR/SmtB family transcription factor [Candidatus Krumholzibacteria bacterium]|nr:metalloregulator ArsR/SmtB family transcription factor [Candidatus Krumholzibacteria bacterium]